MATTKKSTSPTSAPSTRSDYPTVLVEGSVMPAAGVLRRGDQALVPWTETVNDLVKKGFIVIRDENPAEDVVVPPPTSGVNQDLLQVEPPAPEVPSSGVNQDLVQETPPGPEVTEPPAPEPTDPKPEEVPNPNVDNGLVDVNATK